MSVDLDAVAGGHLGAVVAWVTSLAAAGYAGWQTWINHRAGVSGNELRAAEAAATERRDTIADRDHLIAELRAELAERAARFDRLEQKVEELQREREADMTVRMIHGAWDWQRIDELSRLGQHVEPPPPLVSPRPPID